jgi:indolepyruvate ferredoxin oxidoreductase
MSNAETLPTAATGGEQVRHQFSLDDRYTATKGKVLLTGVQAVCRVPVDVRRHDISRGVNTRAFVSGYQGSPLGTLDFAFRPMRKVLDQVGVDFRPGTNEALAATAVFGTQSVPDLGSPYDAITGYWYGKAPGLDQAMDPIRHGNLMGTHPKGGVLAFVGDDASAKSSTVPSSSETALRSLLVPVLAPADSGEIINLGMHGIALSRAAGLWTSLKIATSVADGSSVVDFDLEAFNPVMPTIDGQPYSHVMKTKLVAALAVAAEQNLVEVRLPLAVEYSRLNRLNTITHQTETDKLGIVAAGKIYLEVKQALHDLGLDDDALAHVGIRLLKVAMPWPLEPEIVREFARGLDEVVVVEEKGPFLELLVRDILFDLAQHPRVSGARGADGLPLFPQSSDLSPDTVAKGLAGRLLAQFGDIPSVRARLVELTTPPRTLLPMVRRAPYFCSGCPHNSSTKTPEGSLVGAGIGCHGMAVLMEPSQAGEIVGMTHMGGEGAQWIGQAPYTNADHIFQNLGDGTLAHSGILAIRGAIASGVNITYKILYNATVAMTGGQDAQAGYEVARLCRTLEAEGIKKIAVTTDDTGKYRGVKLPKVAKLYDRTDLIKVQEILRATPGATALIHDQGCAAELRRKRKRKQVPEPVVRAAINERICEGCGDCGRKSNCLSVEPVETPFGRKTQIDQATCNKDYSCFEGECPSFMEVTGIKPAAKRAVAALEEPPPRAVEPAGIAGEYTIRITGIGGTGVVTVAQVLATAGYLDGQLPRGLDQIGLSQKAGPVVSDLRFTVTDSGLSNRAGTAKADLYLGCDIVVAADQGNLTAASAGRTVAVVSTSEVASGAMVRRPETGLPDQTPMRAAIDANTRAHQNVFFDSKALALSLFGDDQLANMMLVGAAYEGGGLPISVESLEQAIELNGVAVQANLQAFRRGRQLVSDPEAVAAAAGALHPAAELPQPQISQEAVAIARTVEASHEDGLADLVTLHVQDLIEYQNADYARQYAEIVGRVRATEQARTGGGDLTSTVATSLHKLMAYKDEYEVARLALDPVETARIKAQFGADAKIAWKLHPPILAALGMKKKITLGPWFTFVFVVLRWMKFLRGTRLDLFGYAAVRRTERRLVTEYVDAVEATIARLTPQTHELALRIAGLPDVVRGYEHVKMANVERYDAELRRLLAELKAAR